MTSVIDISRHSLSTDAHHGNQTNKNKLALYQPLLSIYQSFKTVANKYVTRRNTSVFNGCDVLGSMHTKAFKIRAGLGYRLTALS